MWPGRPTAIRRGGTLSARRPHREAAAAPRKTPWSLTSASIVALLAGFAVASVARSWLSSVDLAVAVVEPLGVLWIVLLQLTVVPLVVSRLVVGLSSASSPRVLGVLGGASFAVFVVLLLTAASFACLITPTLLSGLTFELGTASGAVVPEAGVDERGTLSGATDQPVLLALLNSVGAAVSRAVLPFLFLAALFVVGLMSMSASRRQVLVQFFQRAANVTERALGWVLRFIPLGVFALTFVMTARFGVQIAGVLAYFAITLCAVLLAFTLLLYLVASWVGRQPLAEFAAALVPAQTVAITTRSSLAALPALLEAAHNRLRLPAGVSSFVLPLSSSTFKVHRTISDPVELLFLAKLYGIDLTPVEILSVAALALLLSFGAVGIPSGGIPFSTLPAFVAVGIPVEGIVLLTTVEAIPDIFETLVNVTGDMTAASLVARLTPRSIQSSTHSRQTDPTDCL